MPLNIQINSLLFCLLYGIFFGILYGMNYKILYESKIIFRIIITFLFIIDNILFFYLILLRINNGIIHPYFILMLIMGYYIGNNYYPLIKRQLTRKNKP